MEGLGPGSYPVKEIKKGPNFSFGFKQTDLNGVTHKTPKHLRAMSLGSSNLPSPAHYSLGTTFK